MKVKLDRRKGSFIKAFMANEEPIARAATGAMEELGGDVKVAGRASIAGAGFSRKWQNALRADTYPKGTTSINAAVHVWHKIPYAGVFEEGATIRGKPRLWLPLGHVAPRVGRKRLTPATYPGELHYIARAGRPPLLAARIGQTRAAAKRPITKLTVSAMRKGASGGGKNRVLRSVPVFVGISTVQLRKQFDVGGIVRKASGRIGDLYFKHLKVD